MLRMGEGRRERESKSCVGTRGKNLYDIVRSSHFECREQARDLEPRNMNGGRARSTSSIVLSTGTD
jgi:hypothetical protein